MKEYRITKYNPQNRVSGEYCVHEWTSISDIGKTFDDGTLTSEEYTRVEQTYIDCCIDLLRSAGVSVLSVCCLECYDENIRFPSHLHNENDIRQIISCCLQEKCWARLESINFFIHFGYDYYMYVGTNLPHSYVESTVEKFALYCECIPSPYASHNDNGD